MAELERAARTDWPQELEGDVGSLDPQHDRRMQEAIGQSTALGDAAQRLPEIGSSVRMEEVDRRSFHAQAATLYDQAIRLETAARDGDLHAMQKVLADVEATCRSCHTRFRDISGPLTDR